MISWGWILSGAGPPPGGEPAGGEPGGGDPLGVAVPPWFVSKFLRNAVRALVNLTTWSRAARP